MRVYRGLPNQASRTPCALTIGNFDGVHRGHQVLLGRVRAAADRLGLPACVMTFEPHPREFFAQQAGQPERAPTRISNLRDKLAALATAGIDRVIVEHFNARFAARSAQEFVSQVLVDACHVRWVMVGEDFCFGARRAGNVALLEQAGHEQGFAVESLAAVKDGSERISSSAVRAALAAADFARAAQLLGRPFAISGHIVEGAKLGRTLGYPTLNLRVAHGHPAVQGIFVVRVHGVAEHPVPGVASLGKRPTVDDSGRVLLEVHLFDFAQNVYGRLVRVEFLKKLRDEEKFADLTELRYAIERDAREARSYFGLDEPAGLVAVTTADRIS